MVRWHQRYLTRRKHPGLKTGLLFPSEAGTWPVGNDQLNDVWREVQVMAGIDRPVTVHGIRHSDKHLHYSRGVTVEEMRQASMALMRLVPTGPVVKKGRDG